MSRASWPVFWLALLLFALPMTAGAKPAPPDAIVGFWRTDDGGAIVHIRAADDTFEGRIVWLKQAQYPAGDPRGMGGEAIVDRHNPDSNKRARRVIGLRMIKKLSYKVSRNGRARWSGGRIYDPDQGKWYDCYLRLADRDHLKLRGYIGVPLLGRTTVWRRVADPDRRPPASGQRR